MVDAGAKEVGILRGLIRSVVPEEQRRLFGRAYRRAGETAPGGLLLDTMAMANRLRAGGTDRDVLLCSYPKSGRTWIRYLLTYYQLRYYDIDYDLNLGSFRPVTPHLRDFLPGRPTPAQRGTAMSCLIGSHSMFPWLFLRERVIYMHRDIRDVLVSYYHYLVVRQQFEGPLEEYIWSPQGLARALAYTNRWHKWLSRFPAHNVLIVSYEGMHAAPEEVARQCLELMRVPVDDALLSEAVEQSAAGKMKRLEATKGRYGVSANALQERPERFHVRRARAGGFREELSTESVARIDAVLREELVDLPSIRS